MKINAPELLRKEFSKVPVDAVGLGDYQPIEFRYRLSRQMFQACLWSFYDVLMDDK